MNKWFCDKCKKEVVTPFKLTSPIGGTTKDLCEECATEFSKAINKEFEG